ncbi:cobalamin-binding protein [Daejeonella lutea]|uniref:Iron complex transport system substrate-binding protein n=1 Tax=Daejeonella lutea TaxID=572036 RepID=A0A1T5ERC9_9SPHI|nr:cobalamin-binding protein [Daejeonella lutea]SKB86240.1 iron complex transport system substrate-binding protein [Daejeonella lutea]
MKIISLLPAATEIVCALGLQDQLVGRSHECDFPESVKELPICSSAKFTSGSDSLEIDRQVKEILTDALSIYTIDKELIRTLNPDVIITQAQCEVCAVSIKDVESALEGLLDKECRIVSLEPKGLADVYTDISLIADILGVRSEADHLLERSNERLDIIRHKLKFITEKPKVACIEWLAPLMVAGNWTPELVDIAGGNAILALNGHHSPFVDFQEIVQEDPDIIVVMPCGFSIQRTLQEINLLLQLPGWEELKAVKNNRIYIADGNQYFNRSGPRLTDSIEILAEIINPKQFVFGYEGTGWVKFGI